VRGVKVMRSCLTASALLACVSLGACAGAPIDMSAGLNGAPGQAVHAELHQSATSLRTLIDDEGWTLGDTPLLARLIRGQDSSGDRAVARYLDTADGDASAVLAADAARLTQASQQTASLAMRAASASNAGAETLAADLAAVEGALAAVRRAKGFFASVAEEAQASGERWNAALSELGEAEQHLALAADALAERRWAARLGAVC